MFFSPGRRTGASEDHLRIEANYRERETWWFGVSGSSVLQSGGGPGQKGEWTGTLSCLDSEILGGKIRENMST
jgi:hypothetical protein